MKHNLKLIAAALAFAAAGSANAAIDNAATGNGELFFIVNTATSSFVGDLGIKMDSWTDAAQNITLSSFSQWNAFYSYNGNSLAGARFAVLAVDSTGTSAGSDRMYTTTSQPDTIVPFGQSKQLAGATKAMDNWLNIINAGTDVQGSDMTTEANGSAWSKSSNSTTYWGLTAQDQIYNKVPFVVTAAATDKADFWYAVTGGAESTTTAILKTEQQYEWSFANGDTKLVYGAAVAAIPEADTYAFMALGMGLVGLLARRRKVA